MNKLLLLEDDPRLSEQLARSFGAEQFQVVPVQDLDSFDAVVGRETGFDLVVLDRMIGAHDAKSRLPALKRRWPAVPVMVLSAVNTPLERADLINQGADDYVGKPFLTDELIARARSLVRRQAAPAAASRRQLGQASLDLASRRLSVGDRCDELPAKEFHLLCALSERPGQVLSRAELLEAVWGNVNLAETNLVEATVTNLRRRLAALGCGLLIRNQRNAGYWLEG